MMRGNRRSRAGHRGGRRLPAGDEARFVQGTVIDIDGGRIGVAVIAA
jgi:hypothetical protein